MKNKPIQHIDLHSIKNPEFLKLLSYKELDVLACDIRNYLVDVTSRNGGHLSSNLGVTDATIALCRSFDFSKDKIIFDVGHQCYTYKLLTGRNLESLRKKDGVSGFQKINESSYDHYEAGHSSTSISAALGIAYARDLEHKNFNVISFIGDSSIVNGLSFEALNNNSLSEHKIIVVLNDNDMSISKSVGSLSHFFRKVSVSNFYFKSKNIVKKTFSHTKFGRAIYKSLFALKNFIKSKVLRLNIFDYFGFSVIGPVDGHDIKKMEKAFNQAKKNPKSSVVIIKTIKGKGYKYAEEDKEGKWHGVPKFNIATGEFYDCNNVSWSEYFSSLMYSKISKDNKSICITPGTGYGSGLTRLFNDYPTKCIDVGYNIETTKHAIQLANKYDFLYAICGIHPNDISNNEEQIQYDIDEIRKLVIEGKKIVAIGEIGLDYHYEGFDKELQKFAFIKQIELANELKLPISIHTRDAIDDTIVILRNHPIEYGGVLHCCPFNKELVKHGLEHGLHIAFGGTVTFKNSKNAEDIVNMVPNNRILIETDCPYLAPEPFRGTRNDSSNLKYVVQKLAEFKEMTPEEISKITYENAKKLFDIE